MTSNTQERLHEICKTCGGSGKADQSAREVCESPCQHCGGDGMQHRVDPLADWLFIYPGEEGRP